MITTWKTIIAGFGGQGVLTIGRMLAYAGMIEGKDVTFIPSYGAEMRGGTANCSTIVSDQPISNPIVSVPNLVAAMNLQSLHKFEKTLESGMFLFYNTSVIPETPKRTDIQIIPVDANRIASNIGAPRSANIVMLGAIVRKTKLLKAESVEGALAKEFYGAKAELLPKNVEALYAGEKYL